MSYRFEGLTFNGRSSLMMSRDLAQGLQRMRDVLGTGNVTHVGVYRSTPWMRRSDGSEVRHPPYTGHHFHDAIDIKSWGNHDYPAVGNAARACGLRVVQYDNYLIMVHCEVNYPHNTLN